MVLILIFEVGQVKASLSRMLGPSHVVFLDCLRRIDHACHFHVVKLDIFSHFQGGLELMHKHALLLLHLLNPAQFVSNCMLNGFIPFSVMLCKLFPKGLALIPSHSKMPIDLIPNGRI